MQAFARKLAGLGKLPDAAVPKKDARIVETDVVVVGAGLAGRVIASALAARGARVTVVDDGVAPGGSLLAAPRLLAEVEAKHPWGGAQVLACSAAAGVYRGEVLVASDEGATVVRAKAKVFATGAHDGVLAVPNNDLPGLFSARAIALLAAKGIVPKGTTAIVGEGFWADQAAAALGEGRSVRVAAASVAGIKGTSRVREIYLHGGGAVAADVIAAALPGAPSFEVAEQAGASVRFDPRSGYAVACDARGRAGDGVWAAGECTGAAFDPGEIIAQAIEVAADVIASLGP
jgi:sarcosine oxidase subunit alpha